MISCYTETTAAVRIMRDVNLFLPSWRHFMSTLFPKKKHNFNFQIFYGDPGWGSVTQGHVHQGKCSWSIVEMTFGPKFTDLHSTPKERQLQKSCVSFGEECTLRSVSNTVRSLCGNIRVQLPSNPLPFQWWQKLSISRCYTCYWS